MGNKKEAIQMTGVFFIPWILIMGWATFIYEPTLKYDYPIGVMILLSIPTGLLVGYIFDDLVRVIYEKFLKLRCGADPK